MRRSLSRLFDITLRSGVPRDLNESIDPTQPEWWRRQHSAYSQQQQEGRRMCEAFAAPLLFAGRAARLLGAFLRWPAHYEAPVESIIPSFDDHMTNNKGIPIPLTSIARWKGARRKFKRLFAGGALWKLEKEEEEKNCASCVMSNWLLLFLLDDGVRLSAENTSADVMREIRGTLSNHWWRCTMDPARIMTLAMIKRGNTKRRWEVARRWAIIISRAQCNANYFQGSTRVRLRKIKGACLQEMAQLGSLRSSQW